VTRATRDGIDWRWWLVFALVCLAIPLLGYLARR